MKIILCILAVLLLLVLILVIRNRINEKRRRRLWDNRWFTFSIKPIIYKVPKKELSFIPSINEVIYYETEYNEEYNRFVGNNMKVIKNYFDRYPELSFFYPPLYNEWMSKGALKESIAYNYPALDINKVKIPNSDKDLLTYSDIAKLYCVPEDFAGSGLLSCAKITDDFVYFSIKKLETDVIYLEKKRLLDAGIKLLLREEESDIPEERYNNLYRYIFSKEIYYYKYHCRDFVPRLSVLSDEQLKAYYKKSSADERFKYDMITICKEINERVEKLREFGVASYVIKQMIGDMLTETSRMVIDRHNRIFLPDYNNIEIKLSPIQKAVYFLFLRHEEGICFKDSKSIFQ